MNATLSFNLPEESVEHDNAVHGTDWRLVLAEHDYWLRNQIKHGHPFKSPDEALREARRLLHDAIQDRGLSLD